MVDRRSRTFAVPVVGILTIASLVTGCGAGPDEGGESAAISPDQPADPAPVEPDEAPPSGSASAESGGVETSPPTSPPTSPSITAPASTSTSDAGGTTTEPTSPSRTGSPAPPPSSGGDDVGDLEAQGREALTGPHTSHPGFRIDLVIRAAASGAAPAGMPSGLAAVIAWVEGVQAVHPGSPSTSGAEPSYDEITVELGAGQDPDQVAARIVEVVGDGYEISPVKRPSPPVPDNTIGPVSDSADR